MPADRFGEPWPDATYNGFSGPPGRAAPRRFARPSRGAVIGGLACAALALGLAAGFAFRPDHRTLSVDDAEARVAHPMPIEVNPPAPPAPLPRPAGKLDVLNPATAAAARAAQPAWLSTSAAPATPPPARDASAQTASAPASAPVASGPRSGMSCASSSRADALVCADPELADYDRRLTRAYLRAMRSGAVAPRDLQADQRDWLDDRERAARRSPQAMAQAYESRIDELNQIADDGPG
jgi:uncharacterized protein YecT (DUF1311 family)